MVEGLARAIREAHQLRDVARVALHRVVGHPPDDAQVLDEAVREGGVAIPNVHASLIGKPPPARAAAYGVAR